MTRPLRPDDVGRSGAAASGEQPVLLSYRTLGIGDLLTAVPALRGLRRAFPQHRHVLAAPALLAPLVALVDAVDDHLEVDELASLPAPSSRSSPHVEVAVNLHGAGPQSHSRLLDAAPRQLLAHRHREVWDHADAPAWDPSLHEAARWCRLLEVVGIAAAPGALSLTPPPGPLPPFARGATVVHPGAKSGARRWPAERFAEVARAERAAGRSVVVTGSAAERPLAAAVAQRAGLEEAAVLAGRLDLGALAAVVAAAGRVVCGDTGVAHLATAFATPSVVLFGPSSPATWGPPVDRRGRHRVLWAGRTGDPLGDQPDPGLLEIGPADVLRELAAFDAEPPGSSPAGSSPAGASPAGASPAGASPAGASPAGAGQR